jgi:DNA-binding MarR family transcriptional regulator
MPLMSRAVRAGHQAAPDRAAPRSTPRYPIALARRFYQICTAVTAEVHDHEKTGLRHPEFGVMIRVHDTPGLDQNSLADWMTLDRTTISTLVFRLEQQGFLERAVNGADRRARVLRLTPVGKKLHDRLRPKLQAAQERIVGVLTSAERRSFVEMLARVIEANEAYARPGAGRRRPVRRKAQGSS